VEQSGRHNMRIIKDLPANDTWSFEQESVPNITACIMPDDDVDLVRRLISDPSWNLWTTC
jgi:hypothetical protein